MATPTTKAMDKARSAGKVWVDLHNVRIPDDLREPWQKLLASDASPGVVKALYRVLFLNENWESACRDEMVARSDAWKAAKASGLPTRTRQGVTRTFEDLTTLGQDELEKRLLEEPHAMTPRDLTSITKLASEQAREARSRETGQGHYTSALEALARELAGKGGGSVSLELTVTPTERDEIDITPEEG